ncbi:MAG: hypothetical protein IPM42_06305 [Saprospiraceae bacterium]|nr:hypothetical protein [Saprospiraceae bacterium]
MSKELIIFGFCMFSAFKFCAQTTNTEIQETDFKKLLLNEIGQDLHFKFRSLDSTILLLDERTFILNKELAVAKDAQTEAHHLKERLQYLEQKHATIEESEAAVFQANYQCAIINLVSMEREIKPLTLFNTTREFMSAITLAGNPMEYPGYSQWYKVFYEYVEKEKSKEPVLDVLSHMLSLTGDFGKVVPFGGPVTEPLFSGISHFIQSLGGGKKQLREESRKMFLITASLAQWNHEKDQIEKEWVTIASELENLQKKYDQLLESNMSMMGLNQEQFLRQFCKENDAHKRYSYLTDLKENCSVFVMNEKLTNPKNWKETVYYQMMDIQALKLRFGNITSQIRNNIQKYEELIQRYKSDPNIGTRIAALNIKLKEMSEIFDKAFEPSDYLTSASKMYRVQ